MKSLLYFSYALPLIKGFFFCGIYLFILTLILVSIPCWFLYNGFIEYVLMLAIFLISIGEMLPLQGHLGIPGALTLVLLGSQKPCQLSIIHLLPLSFRSIPFFFLIGLTVRFVGFSSPILVPLDLQGIPVRSFFHFLFHIHRLDSLSVSLYSECCS